MCACSDLMYFWHSSVLLFNPSYHYESKLIHVLREKTKHLWAGPASSVPNESFYGAVRSPFSHLLQCCPETLGKFCICNDTNGDPMIGLHIKDQCITTFSLQYPYAIQYKIDAALKETPNTSSIHGSLEMIT